MKQITLFNNFIHAARMYKIHYNLQFFINLYLSILYNNNSFHIFAHSLQILKQKFDG